MRIDRFDLPALISYMFIVIGLICEFMIAIWRYTCRRNISDNLLK